MNILIWSKGPYYNEYMLKDTTHIEDEEVLKEHIKKYNGDILWIRNGNEERCDLDILSKNIELITKPTILITSDGDRCVPSQYKSSTTKTILNCENITKWKTQNYDGTIEHKKIEHYPIGFDFHTPCNIENKMMYMFHSKLNSRTKIDDLILCDAHTNLTPLREDIFNKFINNDRFRFIKERLTYTHITDLYNQFLFVISPEGNGIDCHRTWELFLAGCIVIKKKSTLDKMFIDNELPVVLIEEWEELNENLEIKLEKWKSEYIKYTDIFTIYKKLQTNYWLS